MEINAFEKFKERIMNGLYQKDHCPNSSENYTEKQEYCDYIRFCKMINSSFYDDFCDYDVGEYYGN